MERHRAQERDACGIGFVADPRGTPRRDVVELALQALARVRHRGATAADAGTGDGAGLLLAIPRRLIASELGREAGRDVLDAADADRIGLAMLFDRSEDPEAARRTIEEACRAERIAVAGWRQVPTDPGALGWVARRSLPRIVQAVLVRPWGSDRQADRAAYRARRRAELALRRRALPAYVCSMSFSTVTYKALASAECLPAFYPDLADPRTEAWFALYHQRFSTNTSPSWERAQPFRLLGHNGEINAIEGNRRRMQGRAGSLGAGLPLDGSGSDSAMLDEAAELLLREPAGEDLFGAIATLIPPAWEHDPTADPVTMARHHWSATAMEPWDGPAAVVFGDGRRVGAALDRNGLRPLPYAVSDDLIVCGSEAGVVDLAGTVRRGRVGAGQLIGVDPARGGLQVDPLREHARRRPYRAWVASHVVEAPEPVVVSPPDVTDLRAQQVAHGYTREELSLVLKPMAATGVEPTFSMGDDTPLPPLGAHGRPVYAFFRQRFAQVTNPAIDHLRERSVMSLRTRLGPRRPVLADGPAEGRIRELRTFLLADAPEGHVLPTTWPAEAGLGGLRDAVERSRREAVEAVRGGAGILLVGTDPADPERVPIPTLLAVGAVDAALTDAGIATQASIVAIADDAREGHHMACLLGFGADAIVPRLAFASVRALADDPEAVARYRTALEQGVLKVLAKLGISCLDSYRGARLFDALGVGPDVMETCFPGIPSPIGGWTFEDFAADALERHAAAFVPDVEPALANPGLVKFRRGGEHHANGPDVVRALHEAVDAGLERLRSTAAGASADDLKVAHALQGVAHDPDDRARYERFAALVDDRPPTEIRDLLDLRIEDAPIPLDEVETAAAILRRFSTGAVSHGSISKEAHETLALAMRLIGGRSNTGEGGEERSRFRTDRNSAIKQVASGRFGVTPEYLAFGEELQIKIAQGSKPGEGGQIPANKVTEEIARLRHTQPGIPLISPAPHHDIYSIEDLAQLIFDLRQVNPSAEVSVKLVASSGVGTVAAGVVKAGADVVQIAGADGGTGASPLSSIKHAGLPWELGLAETQQVLSGEGLRGRVRLRVDGGLKTGRDVLIAALLGADEFSFGTAALLAEGCIMVRTCHLDTCPAGIATQRPELRAKFAGTPEMVAGYLTTVAEHVRRLLASLGLRSLDDATGRTDLLARRPVTGRAARLDPAPLLEPATGERRAIAPPEAMARSSLGDRLFADAWPRLLAGDPVELEYRIANADRSVGARLGGAIGRAFGDGAPAEEIRVRFVGVAGQSFGAFLTEGVTFHLTGEANDYVGKGMSGGRTVIEPPRGDAGDPSLAGNTLLYGATGGELYVAGRVGERFAVRNSGARAVVEGTGANAAEYMTGGTLVILGPTGPNLGAGMTGGEVFLAGTNEVPLARVNPGTVEVARPDRAALERVWGLLSRHARLTGSVRATAILAAWPSAALRLWHIQPRTAAATVVPEADATIRVS